MKKPKNLLKQLATVAITASIFFVACKKENANNMSEALIAEMQMSIEDDAEADNVFDGVFDDVLGVDEEVGLGNGIGIFGSTNLVDENEGKLQPGTPHGADSANRCFTVTRVPNTPGIFPKTITINFGTGCTGRDGRTRRGKIITTYTGRMVAPGSQATTTFDGFYVDSTKVEGTHTVKNNSSNAVRIFTRTIANGKLSKPNGNYIQWNATHTNTQTAGLGTPNFPLDDEFDITGNADGQNKRGVKLLNWTRQITNPLHKKFTCRWFSNGTVNITRNAKAGVLDYGNGTCDNQATMTINGVVKTITLR
jgi:hypothetical protein